MLLFLLWEPWASFHAPGWCIFYFSCASSLLRPQDRTVAKRTPVQLDAVRSMVTAALVMRSVVQTVLIPATTSWVVMPTTHVHKAVVTNLDSVDLDQTVSTQ